MSSINAALYHYTTPISHRGTVTNKFANACHQCPERAHKEVNNSVFMADLNSAQ